MHTKQQLARVELSQVQALIHQHILRAPVELLEEFVLIELLKHQELFDEPPLHIPELLKVTMFQK